MPLLNRLLELEALIEVNEPIYEFTLSPPQEVCPEKELFEHFVLRRHQHFVVAYLKQVHRICKRFVIVPEFDDSGRLHYHGWMTGFDKTRYMKGVKKSLRWFHKIGKVRFKTKWLAYYKKDIHITKKFIPKQYMIFSDCNRKSFYSMCKDALKITIMELMVAFPEEWKPVGMEKYILKYS